MKRFGLIVLCALLILSMTACGKKQADEGTTTTTTTEENKKPVYALDPVINRFFVEFIDRYEGKSLDTRSIRRAPGNANTKPEDLTKEYEAVINGHDVILRNATYETVNDKGDVLTMYQLRIIIQGGATEKSLETLMSTFRLIAPIADPDCSVKSIDAAIDAMTAMTSTGECSVSDYLKVERYTPIIKEYGVPAKIELVALNYVPLTVE